MFALLTLLTSAKGTLQLGLVLIHIDFGVRGVLVYTIVVLEVVLVFRDSSQSSTQHVKVGCLAFVNLQQAVYVYLRRRVSSGPSTAVIASLILTASAVHCSRTAGSLTVLLVTS